MIENPFARLKAKDNQKLLSLRTLLKTIISINTEILNRFEKIYVGEDLLNPFKPYLVMKNFFPIQVIVSKNQIDLISPKETHLSEEHRISPATARMFVKLNTHREIETVADGSKTFEIKVI